MTLESYKILTRTGGKPIDRESSNLEILFKKIGIGISGLEIAEVDDAINVNARVSALPAQNQNELIVKDQLDNGISTLQGQINQNTTDISTLTNNLNALIVQVAANGADISELRSLINRIYDSPPIEEHITAITGQTIFDYFIVQWDSRNTVYDILVFVDGEKQIQDINGSLAEQFRKNSSTQIEFSSPLSAGQRVTVRQNIPYAISQDFFNNYLTGYSGLFVSTVNVYSIGSDRLSVFRNGILMLNTSNSMIGNPVDRYTETPGGILLEQASNLTTYWVMLYKELSSYKESLISVTGTTLYINPYDVGSNKLLVWRNGLLCWMSAIGSLEGRYSEYDSLSINLSLASTTDTVWAFENLATAPIWREELTGIIGNVINFSNPYTMGNEKILLFRNGVLILNTANTSLGSSESRYTETTNTSVTLEVASTADTVWIAINLS